MNVQSEKEDKKRKHSRIRDIVIPLAVGLIAAIGAIIAALIQVRGDNEAVSPPTTLRRAAVLITEEIPETDGRQGEAFCGAEVSFDWQGGPLRLSQKADGSEAIVVDDAIRIVDRRGATVLYQEFGRTGGIVKPREATNIDGIADEGTNEFSIKLENKIGNYRSSAIWLVGEFSKATVKKCEG